MNAVLGTNLSTLTMINVSTEDRFNLLRNEINTAVGGFDGLDKYTKMYVAQSLGLKDVEEAQRFLNMSQAEYLKYNKDMQSRAATEKELADLARENGTGYATTSNCNNKTRTGICAGYFNFTVFADLLAAGMNGFNELGAAGDVILIGLGLIS